MGPSNKFHNSYEDRQKHTTLLAPWIKNKTTHNYSGTIDQKLDTTGSPLYFGQTKSPSSKPKPLVIHFTKDAATQKPRGFQPTSGKKPVPFLYMSDKAVPWKYALKNLMEGRTSPLEITNPLPKLLTSLARAV